MCRKCGEQDKRGSSKVRRQRRKRLLEIHGNGVIAACTWCHCLVANQPGYLSITLPTGRTIRLKIVRMEQDRLMRGGWYSLYNLVPACGPCNRARTYAQVEIPEGCEYGPVGVTA